MIKDNKDYNEDYYVRYGNEQPNRTFYMTLKEAEKQYDEIILDIKTTWKELIYEPLEQEEVQKIIKSDEVKVFDLLGIKVAIPV